MGKSGTSVDRIKEQLNKLTEEVNLKIKKIQEELVKIINENSELIRQANYDHKNCNKEFAKNENSKVLVVCAKIEQELSELEEDEKRELVYTGVSEDRATIGATRLDYVSQLEGTEDVGFSGK